MGKNPNTFQKRQREAEKKRKAEDKRKRKAETKNEPAGHKFAEAPRYDDSGNEAEPATIE